MTIHYVDFLPSKRMIAYRMHMRIAYNEQAAILSDNRGNVAYIPFQSIVWC